MNLISSLLFFIALPMALTIVLIKLMEKGKVTLFGSIVATTLIWAIAVAKASAEYKWARFIENDLVGFIFVLFIPIAVTALFHRLINNRRNALIGAIAISIITVVIYSAVLKVAEGVLLSPIVTIPCILTSLFIKLFLNRPADAIVHTQSIVLTLWVITIVSLTYYLAPPKIDFEITGTVIDKVTRRPIAGAFVLAVYTHAQGQYHYCYETRSMTTGSDGKYHLPVTNIDYLSPEYVTANKPGYVSAYSGRAGSKYNENVFKNPKGFFSGRDIELNPGGANNPDESAEPWNSSACPSMNLPR